MPSTVWKTALLDTSSIVAGLVEDHPAHEQAFVWFEKIQRQEIIGYISLHTLAEVYSTLTGKLGKTLGIQPADALKMIETSILPFFEVIPFTKDDYCSVLQHAASMNQTNGTVYDCIIGSAAWKESLDCLVTLNKKHFDALFPDRVTRIIEP